MSYPYATGKIRVLEKWLPDKTDIERMIGAESFEDAFRVLNDTDLADNLRGLDAHDFQKALNEDLAQTRSLIEKISPDENLFKAIFIKYDFSNIKLLFKARFNENVDYKNNFISFGVCQKDNLVDYIINDNKKILLDKKIKKAIENIATVTRKQQSPQIIDEICDQEYFKLVLEYARKINNSFISNFYKLKIDVANLKILLRGKALNKNEKEIKLMFVAEGKIPQKNLFSLYSKDDEALIKFLKACFSKSEEKLFEDYFREKNLWQLEKAFDNLLFNFLRKAKNITFGPEIILSYFYTKELISSNIRLIMVAKLNKAETIEIKDRLRDIL